MIKFMQKGSLQNYLRENSDLISLRDQIHWSHDLISALLYLSTLNIVHRDIAARNVLLSTGPKFQNYYLTWGLVAASSLMPTLIFVIDERF